MSTDTDLHVIALSDSDLDRLFVCVRHCRQVMTGQPQADELVTDLRNLEQFIGRTGRSS